MKFSISAITVFTVFAVLIALTAVNALPIEKDLIEPLNMRTPQDGYSPNFEPEDNPIPNEKPVCSTDRTAKLYLEGKAYELCSLSTICYEGELGAYCDF